MEPIRNSPSVEQQIVSEQNDNNRNDNRSPTQQQEFSDSARFFILKTPTTFSNREGDHKRYLGSGFVECVNRGNKKKNMVDQKSVKAAYLHCPVRPYIPNPLRCFQCQRFGHSKTVCRGQPTCSRCAEVGHDSADCKAKERCVNCKGDHSSFSRSCPTWILEKEITAVKIKNKISYPEARRVVSSRTPVSGKSYASATSKTYVSTAIQVDASTAPKSATVRFGNTEANCSGYTYVCIHSTHC
ncbi:uncharacterized protein TNCV_87271 [Trichonephila clavipes]|nr:uncharacterized protein TNCV_87271 [Trichonephila clavipes]